MTNTPSQPNLLHRLEEAERERDEALQAIENWFSPWGAWKTAWWEDFSGDREFSSENFIKALGKLLARTALTPSGGRDEDGSSVAESGGSSAKEPSKSDSQEGH